MQDLRSEDFRLFEDQAPQKIESFSVEGNEPVSIAFLLDVSGSMRQSGKLESAKDAVRYLVETLRQGDRFALICFADEQVSWVTEFTAKFAPNCVERDRSTAMTMFAAPVVGV